MAMSKLANRRLRHRLINHKRPSLMRRARRSIWVARCLSPSSNGTKNHETQAQVQYRSHAVECAVRGKDAERKIVSFASRGRKAPLSHARRCAWQRGAKGQQERTQDGAIYKTSDRGAVRTETADPGVGKISGRNCRLANAGVGLGPVQNLKCRCGPSQLISSKPSLAVAP